MKKRKQHRGPIKQRTQITVRIDEVLLGLVNAARKKLKITQAVERGLMLFLHEQGQLAPITHQARFLVAEAPVEQQRAVVELMTVAAVPEAWLTPEQHWMRDQMYAILGMLAERFRNAPSNEFAQTPTREWVVFECAHSAAEGMPKLLKVS